MNIEEKAKRYAKQHAFNNSYDDKSYQEMYGFSIMAYTDAYTQAVTDLSAENEKLRVALRELVALSEAESIDDIIQYEMDHNTKLSYGNSLAKAKQLITEENHGDNKRG